MTKEQKELMALNAGLQLKMEEVSNKIGHQEKKDKASIGYHFTSNEQMMAAIRAVLLDCKIGLTVDMIDYEESFFESKGRTAIRSIVRIKVTITDLETGYSKESYGIGAEQDYGGKSMQQAVTQAFKYWCFKNFKVSSQMEKDPDAVTTEIQPQAKKTTRKTTAKLEPDVIIGMISKIDRMTKSSELADAFHEFGHNKDILAALNRRKKELGLTGKK